MADTMDDLDFFVIQAAFSDENIELSYMCQDDTTENVALVHTVSININDDPMLWASLFATQEIFNQVIIHGHELLRDARGS